MTGNDLRAVEQLRRLATAQEADAGLMERFHADADADAFAELVRRHGPMVLGVCRRVLGNAADADDAFQAAFLVLARKGAAVRNASLASWLFGVARFTAVRARDKAIRRREYEARAVRESPEPPADAELLAHVDEELHRLPDHLRAPLVACVLQGQTQEDAARASGCSLSTLRRRLERGQEVLRKRLTARGLAPALAALGTGSVGLTTTQVQAATALVVAVTTGTAAASPATELAEGAIAMMARTKLKAFAVIAAAAVMIGGIAWGVAAAQPPKPPEMVPPVKDAPKQPPQKVEPPAKPDEPKKDEPTADRIKPGDRVVIRGTNLFDQAPLDPFHEVEPSGKVALGPVYGGRVKIDGLTLEEAEVVVQKHIRQYAIRAQITITRYIPPPPTLDERVQRLEKEVKELRAQVEELRAKRP